MISIHRTLYRRMKWSLNMSCSASTLRTSAMVVLCGVVSGCQTTAGGTKTELAAGRSSVDSNRCDFLPESERPTWVIGRPHTDDYVGVGQAGLSESPEQQIRASEDRARGNLAAEISVKVREQLIQNLCEGQCGEEEQNKISLKAESKTKQTLKGAKIQHRWLDRGSCMLWTLVTLSKDQVEMRRVMMFNLSPPTVEMAGLLVGHLEKVLREDFAVVPADAQVEGCATDSTKAECQARGNTIFGAMTVSLEKDQTSVDRQFRQRNFRVTGRLRFQDREVSSFDVRCKARAEARVDVQTIDRAAAEDCRNKVQTSMKKDLEMMD